MVQECGWKTQDNRLELGSANQSLIEILQDRAVYQAHHLAFRFLPDEVEATAGAGIGWSYAELNRRVGAIATQLTEFAHQPVMLAFPAGLEFVAAFLGCLQARAIAIPVPLPGRHQGLERWQHIVVDAKPRAIMTTAQQLPQVQSLLDGMTTQLIHPAACMTPQAVAGDASEAPLKSAINLDDIALLQYTSGSTSQPRGVMVSHRNLMHNLALIHERFGHSHDSRGVIWLPPHHDMGLIGGVLQPLYGGFPVTLMSPTTFLRQPRRWLQAVSVFGGTTSGGPNFAYERCLQRITPEQRRGLDLSHWELAFTGAEPVQAKTLDQFAEAFADCGFRKAAFYPCYGLAEATLFVSGGTKFTEPTSCAVDRVALAQGRVVTSPAETALPLVSCGQAAADQSILIVDAQTHQPCDADQIGEIWLAGPSVAQGYWHQGEATQEIFEAQLADGSGPFLRTGDLGFWRRGELFVTGRLKDLIIIRGQNHYPQDIEQTAAHSHEALRRQAGAAFSVEIAGKERLILVQEVQRTALRSLNTKAVIEAIRAAVSRRHGLQIYGVVLLKPGSLPKTTSGKVQRHACKAQFQDGALAAVGQWQVAQSPVASPLSTPMSPAEQPSLSWQDLQDYNQFAAWPTNSPSAASTPSNINASGDIEQSLAGEKATLDMQLRQKPVHYSPNAKSLERWLIQWLAQRLQISAADMDTHKAFADYGVDSVMAVELAQDLEELLRLQQSLDVTLAWNFPTIAALAAHLAIDASAQTAQNLADAATERRDSELVKVDATDFQSSTLNSPHEAPALDDLSEAEMAKVLAAELAALSGRKA